MNSRIIQLATALAVLLLSTIAVSAQTTTKDTLLRANIPFAFVTGGVHLPAGEYRFYHPGNPYVIVIENNDGTARAMTIVHPSATNSRETNTKLVFNKYGTEYFLAQVWTERNQEVHQCFRCRMEQTFMAKVRRPTVVVVAAMR